MYNPINVESREWDRDKHETSEDNCPNKLRLQCNLCGKIFPSYQRHGPIDLDNLSPIGFTNESEVCSECVQRKDKVLLFKNDLEHIAICQECWEMHHHEDFFRWKYAMLIAQIRLWRNQHAI